MQHEALFLEKIFLVFKISFWYCQTYLIAHGLCSDKVDCVSANNSQALTLARVLKQAGSLQLLSSLPQTKVVGTGLILHTQRQWLRETSNLSKVTPPLAVTWISWGLSLGLQEPVLFVLLTTNTLAARPSPQEVIKCIEKGDQKTIFN